MSYWLIDRTLPSVVASAIWAAVMWVQHRTLKRHITRVTEQQSAHIDQLTADQTREITGKGEAQ